mmetsp:Transcript_45377/g.82915  ORF Transcript_45377/g.82915 Transcript_45377/m.82915 type:complete len:207 (+) Transcript_45377:296-916(+)
MVKIPKLESSMVAGGGPSSNFPAPINIACLWASPRWMRNLMSFVIAAASERMSKESRLLFAMLLPTVTVAKACAMSAGPATFGSRLSLKSTRIETLATHCSASGTLEKCIPATARSRLAVHSPVAVAELFRQAVSAALTSAESRSIRTSAAASPVGSRPKAWYIVRGTASGSEARTGKKDGLSSLPEGGFKATVQSTGADGVLDRG